MTTLFSITADHTSDDLQDTLIHLSIELAARMDCPVKQALSTTLEYKLTDYINAAHGYAVVTPEAGCHGADALWIKTSPAQTVEYKATEIDLVKEGNMRGRLFGSPTFSFLDWPAQLSKRDRVVCGVHDENLNYVAALMIPPHGVNKMYEHAVTTYGSAATIPGARLKATFSMKTMLQLSPPQWTSYILNGQLVRRDQYVEAFFGRKDNLYLDLFY